MNECVWVWGLLGVSRWVLSVCLLLLYALGPVGSAISVISLYISLAWYVCLHAVSLIRHLRCISSDGCSGIRLSVLTGRNAHWSGGDHQLLLLNDHGLFVVGLLALLLALGVIGYQGVHFGGVFAGDLNVRSRCIVKYIHITYLIK